MISIISLGAVQGIHITSSSIDTNLFIIIQASFTAAAATDNYDDDDDDDDDDDAGLAWQSHR